MNNTTTLHEPVITYNSSYEHWLTEDICEEVWLTSQLTTSLSHASLRGGMHPLTLLQHPGPLACKLSTTLWTHAYGGPAHVTKNGEPSTQNCWRMHTQPSWSRGSCGRRCRAAPRRPSQPHASPAEQGTPCSGSGMANVAPALSCTCISLHLTKSVPRLVKSCC